MKNVEAGSLFRATKTKREEISALQYFKVEAEDVISEELLQLDAQDEVESLFTPMTSNRANSSDSST